MGRGQCLYRGALYKVLGSVTTSVTEEALLCPHDQPVLAPDKSLGDSCRGRASVSTFPHTHIHPSTSSENSTTVEQIPHLPQR